MLDWKTIIVRAVVTFFEVAVPIVFASGAANLDIATLEAAAIAGGGAAISVLYNAARLSRYCLAAL